MPVVNLIVIVVAVAAVIGLIVWFVSTRNDPERMSTHDDTPVDTTSQELYDGAKRPAGPDVDLMDPDLLGGDQRPPSSPTPEADAGSS